MKVPAFTDIGKDAREIIYGGRSGVFQYNNKLKITSKSAEGVEFNLGTTIKDDKLTGDFKAKYQTPHKVDVEVAVDSNSKLVDDVSKNTTSFEIFKQYYRSKILKQQEDDKVTVTATAANVAPGLKAVLSGSIPSVNNSGKLALEYSMPHLMVKSNIGLTATPAVDVSVATGSKGFILGGACSFATSANELKTWSVGAGYVCPAYTAGVVLSDKGDTVKASYSHVLTPGQSAALEVTRALPTAATTFTLGYSRILQNNALGKVKLDNNGICGLVYEQSLDKTTKVCFSGQFNATDLDKPVKYGVSLGMNH